MNYRQSVRLRSSLRDLIVLVGFIPPLDWIASAFYRWAVRHVTNQMRQLPYVEEVNLTGSVALEDCIYGASDLDFIVLVSGAQDKAVIRRAMRQRFKTLRRIIPFIGSVDERSGNVFFTDDVDDDPFAAVYRCRRKTQRLQRLYAKDEAGPARVGDLSVDEVLAEVMLQLQSVVIQALLGDPDLYFWKSKIRALLPLLPGSPDWSGLRRMLDAPDEVSLVRRLESVSNRRLYFSGRRGDQSETAWGVLQKMVRWIVAEHGLSGLATTAIEVRSSPARLAPLGQLNMPPVIARHPYVDQPKSFGGEHLLSTSTDPYALLELLESDFKSLKTAADFIRNNLNEAQSLLWSGDFVFQIVRGRCRGVFSRWDRPHLFPENFNDAGSLNYPTTFLDCLLTERDNDLKYLKDSFYWRLCDNPVGSASATMERHDTAIRYFEMRDRVLSGFGLIHICHCLSRDRLANFGTLQQVFADAANQLPAHGDLIGQLARLSLALSDKSLQQQYADFPPALLRSGMRLFADVLYGNRLQGDYGLQQQLGLSLCICTRNRADQLQKLFDSIMIQSRRPDEVIIVDNASTDGTARIVERFGHRCHPTPVRHIVDAADTIAKLRNRAVAESTLEIICFTDDDCILHPGWFHFVEESFLLEEQIGAVGGRMCHLEEEDGALNFFHREYLGARL